MRQVVPAPHHTQHTPVRLASLLLLACTAACGSPKPFPVLSDADVARVDSLMSNPPHLTQDQYGYPIDTIDRREILRLLRVAQFDSLDAILSERWDATKADIRSEGRLAHVYDSFVQATGTIEPELDKWIAERPGVASARVAMAMYEYGRALEGRGGDVARRTSEQQFATSRDHAEKGLAAAREALRLAPDHLIAYVVVLGHFQRGATTDPESARALVQSAMAAHPTSFLLRQAILGMLQPRWGGSLDLMRQFVASADGLALQNPKLRALAGAVAQEEAFMKNDDYGMALALLDQANFHGEHYMLDLAYGDLHLHNKRPVDALIAYQRALALSPQGRTVLDDRSSLLVQVGSLIADETVREKVFAEAERTLNLLRELQPPYADPSDWLARLSNARANCAKGPAPCLDVY